MDEAAEREFAEYFRARRDAVRRTAFLLCGDWHRADDHARPRSSRCTQLAQDRDRAALDAGCGALWCAPWSTIAAAWRRERATAEHLDTASEPSASDAVATRHVLVTGLRAVPPRQRAVLVLRYLEGLDVAGTAAALGCTEGTVKSQTAHGLAALRATLGDALDDLRPAG